MGVHLTKSIGRTGNRLTIKEAGPRVSCLPPVFGGIHFDPVFEDTDLELAVQQTVGQGMDGDRAGLPVTNIHR
ncbi:hypothetical protein M977_04629 [Buttiauxella gaviniae ATCC 51604]|uniref:Uncharacterized protein n=1 Tax=Buttiauxella gaviniae ATCC 51604 TaxID=1354253 RepID=A0A1B7HLB0_9ENTR|nr:hypothetical protein M977_04629 [Buttiauxella gaviniae ATCC 51604]